MKKIEPKDEDWKRPKILTSDNIAIGRWSYDYPNHRPQAHQNKINIKFVENLSYLDINVPLLCLFNIRILGETLEQISAKAALIKLFKGNLSQ